MLAWIKNNQRLIDMSIVTFSCLLSCFVPVFFIYASWWQRSLRGVLPLWCQFDLGCFNFWIQHGRHVHPSNCNIWQTRSQSLLICFSKGNDVIIRVARDIGKENAKVGSLPDFRLVFPWCNVFSTNPFQERLGTSLNIWGVEHNWNFSFSAERW